MEADNAAGGVVGNHPNLFAHSVHGRVVRDVVLSPHLRCLTPKAGARGTCMPLLVGRHNAKIEAGYRTCNNTINAATRIGLSGEFRCGCIPIYSRVRVADDS
jgi:hypothetical protein